MAGAHAPSYDYVAVGHVTVDVLLDADGRQRRQPGGGAFYSALQAARMGLRTLTITRGQPDELNALLAPFAGEMTVEILPAAQSTTLQTWGHGPQRAQRLQAWAGPISAADLPAAATPALASILHLAPVAQETPPDMPMHTAFVGLTAQGLVRRWQQQTGEISIGPIETARLPSHLDAVTISSCERASCAALFERPVAVIAVTAGEGPTSIHLAAGGAEARVAPKPISGAHDDLGAGDVFAAAFFIALHEGLPPLQAAARGNAAAAVRISGRGPEAIGDLAAIERRALQTSA